MSIPRHTAYNLAGGLLPLGLSLVTIPIYIGQIGEARYGVLAIAWLLLGYFGLFDLGLGAATAQHMASLPPGDAPRRAQVFWTALAMNLGLGVLGSLVLVPVAYLYFDHSAAVEPWLRPEIAHAIPWLALALPLATMSGVLTGALQGRSRFLELNAISIAGAVLTQLLPLAVVAWHGPELAWLLVAVVFSRLLVLATLFWRCREHIFKGARGSVSAAHARSLLAFGGWVTVSALVGPLMVVLDRFAIGGTMGPKAVTYYTVPFTLAERTTLLPGALSGAIFPRLASLPPAEARVLAGTAIRTLAVVMTPLIAAGVLLIQPFIAWWLKPEFAAVAALPGQLLLLGFWINSIARAPLAHLQAIGRPDAVAKCHLLEVVPYLVLLYLGLHLYGIAGAATVFGLRVLVDCLLLMYNAGTLRESVRVLAIPALLLLAVFALVRLFPAQLSPAWIAMASLALLVPVAWAAANAPQEMRQLARRKLGLRP